MAKKSGIPIPNVIDPPETMQVTLCIPKNYDHMSAFFGALWELTIWNNWQPDEAHSGTQLAAVWMRYYTSWTRGMSDIDCETGMAKCCIPPVTIKRIDPVTGRPQISVDDGATWQSDPDDPQYAVLVQPPIVGEGLPNTKCDAASNAKQHFTDLVNQTSSNIATASTVYAFVSAVVVALAEIAIFILTGGLAGAVFLTVSGMIWGGGQAVFTAGQAAFDSYWDSDNLDKILCALYNHIGDNGQFTEDQFQAFLSEARFELPSNVARDFVFAQITAAGAAGLSNMASYGGSADSDCSDCEDSPDTWFVFADGHIEGIFPDSEGVYHVESGTDTLYPGVWYGTVWFTNPDFPVYNSTCRRMEDITIVTGTPLIENYVNCDGGSTVQFCNNAYQYVDNATWSMTFTSPPACP